MDKFYYKIKMGSNMYVDLHKVYNSYKDWFKDEVKKDIIALIGYDYGSTFVCDSRILYVDANKIKAEDRGNYCKDVIYQGKHRLLKAKKTSKVNKEYLAICKKYDLTSYDFTSFRLDYFFGYGISIHPFLDDVYVIECKKELDDCSLEKISEVDFMQLGLDLAKYKEEKANSSI